MAASTLTYDAFVGLSADTGAAVSGLDHLVQSLRDIITTPVGYGSSISVFIDYNHFCTPDLRNPFDFIVFLFEIL